MVPILLDFWAETSHDPQVTQRLVEVYAEYRRLLRRIVQEGIASGELRPLDVDQVATILCGIYDGLMLQWVLKPEAVPWPVVADTLIELLLHGLQSGSSQGNSQPLQDHRTCPGGGIFCEDL